MKKYILFIAMIALLVVDYLTTQTATNNLQTTIDVEVHATVLPAQHALQLVDEKGIQLNTVSFVQNISSENPTDTTSKNFTLQRGVGPNSLRISTGVTEMTLSEESINFSNGAVSNLNLESSQTLGTTIQKKPNTVTSTATVEGKGDMSTVSTAFPQLTVTAHKTPM